MPPQSINLSRKPAIDKEALLARATGADNPNQQMRVPQPAKPTGVVGELPLPAGRVVGARSPSSLTPSERETLTNLGWTEDIPIPANMAQLVAEAKAEAALELANLPPPVDPRKPPLSVQTQDIKTLSPELQSKFTKKIIESVAQEEARKKDEADRARIEAMGKEATLAYDMAKAIADRQEMPIVNDLIPPTTTPAPTPTAAPEAAPDPETPATAPTSDLGLGGETLTRCQHCDWPLHMPDMPEPAHSVKLAFLHSILGQQCFTHQMSLFGDAVVVTFRTLTARELDVVFKQAYRDLELGRITEEPDFWNKVNRYRLFLQLLSIHASDPKSPLQHDLPDGLSEEANDMATGYWTGEPDDGETLLPIIEDYIVGHVLRTENIFRVVSSACNQFSRLVAKLEALTDNSPFWAQTAPPS